MNRLAHVERERLFSALEKFVNLGDSLQDLKNFREQWPAFFPPDVYDQTEKLAQPGAMTEYWPGRKGPVSFSTFYRDKKTAHFLVVYRDWLRQIWRDPESAYDKWLFWMLGIEQDQNSEYSLLVDVPTAACRLNWKTGQFEYEPVFDFQSALYLLFKSGWRAKMCARCSRCFIARKPAQLYCGTDCSAEVKRDRGNAWWRQEGNSWRKSRLKAAPKWKKRRR